MKSKVKTDNSKDGCFDDVSEEEVVEPSGEASDGASAPSGRPTILSISGGANVLVRNKAPVPASLTAKHANMRVIIVTCQKQSLFRHMLHSPTALSFERSNILQAYTQSAILPCGILNE